MTWSTEWRALAARIEGLGVAGNDLMRGLTVQNYDALNVTNRVVRPSGHRLFQDLRAFRDRYQSVLPSRAVEVIDGFLGPFENSLSRSGADGAAHATLQLVAVLRAVKAEIDYYFSDAEITARRVVERAFLHLQRSLSADDDVRWRWKQARGEVGCEKLGLSTYSPTAFGRSRQMPRARAPTSSLAGRFQKTSRRLRTSKLSF